MMFDRERKEQLSKIYPDLKWIYITDIEGTPFYFEEKSMQTGKCRFLQDHKDGKKACQIYELRPQICHAYGDHDYPLYVCDRNPKFNRREYEKENGLVDAGDAAANQRYNDVNVSIFTNENVLTQSWSCKQCGACCHQPVAFNAQSKEGISKKYPDLKWTRVPKHGDPSFWFDDKSQELGRCQFLKRTADGKYECIVYDFRSPMCRIFGDHKSHPLYICHKNSTFNHAKWEEEKRLIDKRDPAALQRHAVVIVPLFTR